MTTRIALSDFQQGMLAGLQAAEKIARKDLRVELAKEWNYQPGWHKGRLMVADDIGNLIRDLGVDGVREDGK